MKVRRFNPKEHNLSGKVIQIIGDRQTGKTNLVKDLLYNIDDMPFGKIISETEEVKPFYKFFVPTIFIDNKFDEKKVNEFCEYIINMHKINYERKNNEDDYILDNRSFFVLDDVNQNVFKNSPVLNDLFQNGRHYNHTLFVTIQDEINLPQILRDQVDYTFVTGVRGGTKFRDNLYEHYAKGFADKKEFGKVLDACTQNYNVLVIKNCDTTNEFENSVFWYNAKEHPGFRMCENLWRVNKKKLDILEQSNDWEEIELID